VLAACGEEEALDNGSGSGSSNGDAAATVTPPPSVTTAPTATHEPQLTAVADPSETPGTPVTCPQADAQPEFTSFEELAWASHAIIIGGIATLMQTEETGRKPAEPERAIGFYAFPDRQFRGESRSGYQIDFSDLLRCGTEAPELNALDLGSFLVFIGPEAESSTEREPKHTLTGGAQGVWWVGEDGTLTAAAQHLSHLNGTSLDEAVEIIRTTLAGEPPEDAPAVVPLSDAPVTLSETGGPPPVILQAATGTQAGGIGTYCWGSICADMVGTPFAPEPLSVAGDELVRFDLNPLGGAASVYYEIYTYADGVQNMPSVGEPLIVPPCVAHPDRATPPPCFSASGELAVNADQTVDLQLALDPGAYVISIFVGLGPERGGDTSQGFHIVVE
jgi:hypothetical protein